MRHQVIAAVVAITALASPLAVQAQVVNGTVNGAQNGAAQGNNVGVVLPRDGVSYYDVPHEYMSRPGYRYTVVNDRAVIVDPKTRRVVEVLD